MLTKGRVRQWLEERFFLRWHMTIILGGTFLAGMLMTKLLMMGGVNRLALRYVIAVAAAYLAFLVLVRLWLAYVGSGGVDLTDTLDFAEMAIDASGVPRFHGGGSKGSWDLPDVGVGGDLDDLVVLIVLFVVVICLCGFAIYFIYNAPVLLSEAAFEAALAAALARRARKATGPGWIGPVWRATVWPFLIVLVLSGVLGWAAQRACPEATRLREAVTCEER